MTSSSMNVTSSLSSHSSQMIEIGRVVEIRSSRSQEEDAPAIIPVMSTTTRSSTMFEEFSLDDIDTPVSSSSSPVAAAQGETECSQGQETVNKGPLPRQLSLPHHGGSAGYKLRPTVSVPASLWLSSPSESGLPQYPEHTFIRVRAYSCPPSLTSMATSLEAILLVLTSAHDIESIVSALKQLASQLRWEGEECDGVRLVEGGVIPVVMDMLQENISSHRVVEMCCRVLKLLTREGECTLAYQCISIPRYY